MQIGNRHEERLRKISQAFFPATEIVPISIAFRPTWAYVVFTIKAAH